MFSYPARLILGGNVPRGFHSVAVALAITHGQSRQLLPRSTTEGLAAPRLPFDSARMPVAPAQPDTRTASAHESSQQTMMIPDLDVGLERIETTARIADAGMVTRGDHRTRGSKSIGNPILAEKGDLGENARCVL